jgi:integrase
VTCADIESVKTAIKEGKTSARRKAKFRSRSITTGGPGVANRTVSLLSKMMGCAVDWDMRPDKPALRIKKYPERRKDRFLDIEEIRRPLAALDQASLRGVETIHTIACLRLLLLTGLRLGEFRDMHWKDIDLARGTLRLRDSKTGARTVPLNDQAIAVLQNTVPQNQISLLFRVQWALVVPH